MFKSLVISKTKLSNQAILWFFCHQHVICCISDLLSWLKIQILKFTFDRVRVHKTNGILWPKEPPSSWLIILYISVFKRWSVPASCWIPPRVYRTRMCGDGTQKSPIFTSILGHLTCPEVWAPLIWSKKVWNWDLSWLKVISGIPIIKQSSVTNSVLYFSEVTDLK